MYMIACLDVHRIMVTGKLMSEWELYFNMIGKISIAGGVVQTIDLVTGKIKY